MADAKKEAERMVAEGYGAKVRGEEVRIIETVNTITTWMRENASEKSPRQDDLDKARDFVRSAAPDASDGDVRAAALRIANIILALRVSAKVSA